MGNKITYTKLPLKGAILFKTEPIEDMRGYFMRVYDHRLIFELIGDIRWSQENHSYTKKKGTIRGLHFQLKPFTESKLIRCIRGEIQDIIVDLRRDSETFGLWHSEILSDKNNKIIFVPRGFAHGYCTLSDDTEVLYKVDNIYNKEYECGVRWNDDTLKIDWAESNPILSERDARLPFMSEIKDKLNFEL